MRKLLLCALIAVGVALPAHANLIDQNQPSGPVYMAAFDQTGLAQSFQQTNTNISGAGILLQANVGGTDNVVIELWNALPNAGGMLMATGNATGTQGQWVDVYWDPVSVDQGSTYYLVFTGNMTLGIAGDTSNPYPFGHVFANPGYQPFPDFDYAFRTYYSEDPTPVIDSSWGAIKNLYR